jgi:hypothetical protein
VTKERKISYKITDMDALQAAFPQMISERTVVQKVVNKKLLYKVLKLNKELGINTPGVTLEEPQPMDV